MVRPPTADAGGQVIQLRGDGMLCMFPGVDAALVAAVSMRDLPYEEPLSMHAGLHVGGVLRDRAALRRRRQRRGAHGRHREALRDRDDGYGASAAHRNRPLAQPAA